MARTSSEIQTADVNVKLAKGERYDGAVVLEIFDRALA